MELGNYLKHIIKKNKMRGILLVDIIFTGHTAE